MSNPVVLEKPMTSVNKVKQTVEKFPTPSPHFTAKWFEL